MVTVSVEGCSPPYLQVFPDLRLWCEQRKLRLVECDLRWVRFSTIQLRLENVS